MQAVVERRRSERFSVKNDFLALLWPASSKIGKIVDISLGGIAICYFIRSVPKNAIARPLESELEIISHRQSNLPWIVPIETVSDIKLDGCFAGNYLLQHRRRSLKFRTQQKTKAPDSIVHSGTR